MNQWFRFYNEVLNDPKVQKLNGDTFKQWVNLLCLTSANDGALPPIPDVAFALRLSDKEATDLLQSFHKAGLLDRKGPVYSPHNWDVRQFKSDVSTSRVKRFRDRFRNVSETTTITVTETPPEQIQSRADTESETETEKKPPAASFTLVWDQYPKKIGRKEAERHFRASVKTGEDEVAILAALTKYLEHIAKNPTRPYQDGSTWFNNWRDWIDWIEPTKGVAVPSGAENRQSCVPHYSQEVINAEIKKQFGLLPRNRGRFD